MQKQIQDDALEVLQEALLQHPGCSHCAYNSGPAPYRFILQSARFALVSGFQRLQYLRKTALRTERSKQRESPLILSVK